MLSIKGYRPSFVADTNFRPDRRLRHPAVQEEIEFRVAIYAEQVEKHGRIGKKWLPWKGSGKSASDVLSGSAACAASAESAASADECLRVLGESE